MGVWTVIKLLCPDHKILVLRILSLIVLMMITVNSFSVLRVFQICVVLLNHATSVLIFYHHYIFIRIFSSLAFLVCVHHLIQKHLSTISLILYNDLLCKKRLLCV